MPPAAQQQLPPSQGIAPLPQQNSSTADFNPFPWLQAGLKAGSGLLGSAGTNLGGTGFNLSDVSGPLGIVNGLYNGDPRAAVGGGLQTAASLARQAWPDLFGDGAGALSGSVGNIAGGLGLIGGLAGNNTLSQIGGAIGGIPAAATIASAIPALSSGALTALSANPYTAAVAAAVVQIMDMYSHLDRGASGLNTFLSGLVAPIRIIGSIAGPAIDKAFMPSEKYQSFAGRVGETAGLEGSSLNSLMRGLPYVQSQEELGSLMNEFKRVIGTQVGGYGAGSGQFDLPALPEVGARTHGMATTPTDFASTTPGVQEAIRALLPMLPATAQTSDDAMMRNFYQFGDRRALAGPQADMNAPIWNGPDGTIGGYGQRWYGEPGYDYAATGYPTPGTILGSVSPAWQRLLPGYQAQASRPEPIVPWSPKPPPSPEEQYAAMVEGQRYQDFTSGGG